MLKVKVNLDKESFDSLIKDMILFHIQKKDQTINKNKFMNLLFENYYEIYNQDVKRFVDETNNLMNKYGIEQSDFAYELANNYINVPYLNENQKSKSLMFYLDDENEFIFENLNQHLRFQSVSSYFRKLIYGYLALPEYKREKILYKNTVSIFEEACLNQEKLIIELDNRPIEFSPYKICSSKEELYSYLVGYTDKGVTVIHLYKVKNIMIKKEFFSFNKSQIECMETNIEKGIQFAVNNFCEARIRFTEKGLKKFSSRYLNRPTPIKIEENEYVFSCSAFQLMQYFIAFGKDIEIIYPDFLSKKLYLEYKGYIDNYDNKKVK